MPKEIKEKIIKLLNKIEITPFKNGKVAIFWLNEKKISPEQLADQILELFEQEKCPRCNKGWIIHDCPIKGGGENPKIENWEKEFERRFTFIWVDGKKRSNTNFSRETVKSFIRQLLIQRDKMWQERIKIIEELNKFSKKVEKI